MSELAIAIRYEVKTHLENNTDMEDDLKSSIRTRTTASILQAKVEIAGRQQNFNIRVIIANSICIAGAIASTVLGSYFAWWTLNILQPDNDTVSAIDLYEEVFCEYFP